MNEEFKYINKNYSYKSIMKNYQIIFEFYFHYFLNLQIKFIKLINNSSNILNFSNINLFKSFK
jgi:hypothetical protein